MADVGEIHINEEAFEAGVLPAIERFAEQGGETDTLAMRSQHILIRDQQPGAYFVPVVRFAVDATLGIVQHPDVAKQLSSEITDRAYSTASIAMLIASTSVGNEMLKDVYRQSKVINRHGPIFGQLIDHLANTKDNKDYIGKLAAAPFSDAAQVVGGAIKFLRTELPNSPEAETIAVSYHLLSIARLDKKATRDVFKTLGFPYTQTRHFKAVESDNKQPRVTFTGEVMDFLEPLYGKGCPAGKLPAGESSRPSLLEVYWDKIVRSLVSDNVTVDSYREHDIPLPKRGNR